MPTVRWEPRRNAQRFYFRSLERFDRMKTMEALGTALLVNVLLFLLKSRRKQLTADSRRRRLIIMVGLILSRQALLTEWSTPRTSVRYPSPGVKTHGAESEFWTEDLFDDMFRFRRHHFLYMMDAVCNETLKCYREDNPMLLGR